MAAWIASALLTLALAPPLAVRAADVVPAERAADVVGSTVTIEGDVAVARLEPDALVLELAPAGEKSFRAVLVLALISSLPRQPERIYEGKRIRVTGKVQRFRGRPEMVLESASSIEIVDLAGAPAESQTTVPTTTLRSATVPTTTLPAPTDDAKATPPPPTAPTPAPPSPAVAPTPAPPPAVAPTAPPSAAPAAAAPPAPVPPPPAAAAPPPEPPAPTPAPLDAPRLLADKLRDDACKRARLKWTDAATAVRQASTALTRCLDAGSYQCRDRAKALAPAIADLEWAEQNVADNCN